MLQPTAPPSFGDGFHATTLTSGHFLPATIQNSRSAAPRYVVASHFGGYG